MALYLVSNVKEGSKEKERSCDGRHIGLIVDEGGSVDDALRMCYPLMLRCNRFISTQLGSLTKGSESIKSMDHTNHLQTDSTFLRFRVSCCIANLYLSYGKQSFFEIGPGLPAVTMSRTSGQYVSLAHCRKRCSTHMI